MTITRIEFALANIVALDGWLWFRNMEMEMDCGVASQDVLEGARVEPCFGENGVVEDVLLAKTNGVVRLDYRRQNGELDGYD